jgi:hypothetical protein
MKTIIEGVLAGNLPWDLVLSGAGLSIGAMLCGVSGLAFAIGVYLSLASMAPIFVGGCVRALVERRRAGDKSPPLEGDPGVLAASGMVAGEGLMGVIIAGAVALQAVPQSIATPRVASWTEALGLSPSGAAVAAELTGLALILLACLFLYRSGASRAAPS